MPPPSNPASHLLESKFRPQLGARASVERGRLVLPQALTATDLKVVTVVAPTGYGKSTLMAQWYALLNHPAGPGSSQAAWLNLDDNDNDAARLLRYLYGALGCCIPELAAMAERGFVANANVSVLLEQLSIRLDAHARPVVLFLDDAHVIVAPEAVRMVEWLLRHGGPHWRFVIGSRQALAWPLAELRIRGQLLEVDQRALTFNAAEAIQFCGNRLQRMLDAPLRHVLLEKTEGWPAAMELLAMALNDAPDAASLIADFSSTERGVFEYLSDVVFSRMPEPERALAHQLGQFDRFCSDLIGAATGRRSPDLLFATLQRRQLFLIPLDGHGRWFRFHHLVGDYLRRHDPRPDAAIQADLAGGGHWLFDQGMVDDAIDCAVRGRHWHLACRWLVDAAEDSAQRQGAGANLLRWIPAIPGQVLDSYPQVRLSYVFSLAFHHNEAAFQQQIADLEALVDRLASSDRLDSAVLDDLRAALPVQRMLEAGLRDQSDGLLERAEAWFAQWPNARLRYRGDLSNLAAYACKAVGEIDRGLQYCERARRIQNDDNSHYGIAWNFVLRALLHLKGGDFAAALATADDGLAYVQAQLYSHPEMAGYLHAVRAYVLYDFDHLDAAAQALETGLGALDDVGIADFLLLTYLTRARLQFCIGQSDAGLSALHLGRKLGQRRDLHRVAVTLACEECIWRSRLGDRDGARELARAQNFDRTLFARYDVVADKAARVGPRLSYSEQPELAVAQLGPALVRATEKGFQHRRVELLILHSAALLRAGRIAEGANSWRTALEIGERFGYRRVFLDDIDIATSVATMARSHCGLAMPQWLQPPPKAPGVFAEALTRKELRILDHLESGANNREIAESLFISEGTLKWHLHNIYRKLGCRNRTGALAAFRRRRNP